MHISAGQTNRRRMFNRITRHGEEPGYIRAVLFGNIGTEDREQNVVFEANCSFIRTDLKG
ncbi:hypothetical protein CS542_05895 [Pedobacter sp. IW39]|nr:hypothetical protein CS542_05895 [Pedobacter sp. IW39]